MIVPDELLKDKFLIRKGDDLFLFDEELPFKNFVFGGLYLGNTDKPGLPVCYELSKTKFPRVTVSNQSAEKFTRGGNVFRKAVVKGRVTGTVLVMNKQGDCLGVGVWGEDLLLNIRDVGEYLRIEKDNGIV